MPRKATSTTSSPPQGWRSRPPGLTARLSGRPAPPDRQRSFEASRSLLARRRRSYLTVSRPGRDNSAFHPPVETQMATVGDSADSEGTSLPSSDGPRDPLRLLQSLPVPIFVAVDHHIIFVNEAQTRILGAAVPGDVIGQSLEGFISPESREAFFATMDEVAGSVGTSKSITEKWLRVDGRLLNIEYVIKSIPYEDRVAIEGVLRKVVIEETPSKQQRSAENAEAEQRRAEVSRLTESLKSERAAAAESLREAVARERKQAEDRLQSALAEERRRSARAMDEAANESRKAAEAKTQEAISRERAAAQEALARERKKFQEEIGRARTEAAAE